MQTEWELKLEGSKG